MPRGRDLLSRFARAAGHTVCDVLALLYVRINDTVAELVMGTGVAALDRAGRIRIDHLIALPDIRSIDATVGPAVVLPAPSHAATSAVVVCCMTDGGAGKNRQSHQRGLDHFRHGFLL